MLAHIVLSEQENTSDHLIIQNEQPDELTINSSTQPKL